VISDVLRLFRRALLGWWNDRALSMGAAIAFFTIFSLAPMLLAAVAVAGLAFGRDAAQGAIVTELAGVVGQAAAETIQALVLSASNIGSGVIGTTIGSVTFLILVTGAIIELQEDLNVIWKVKPPEGYSFTTFIRTRLLSFSLILGIGFLLLVALVIDAGVTALGSLFDINFSGAATFFTAINKAIAFGVAVLLFAMIFKILPDVSLTWHDVWAGALVTAVLFSLGKFLIGLYLGASNVASSYGAAASLITILLWIYYSALILLFGAEFTKAYAESRGSRQALITTDTS
jgi:membrane protein